MAPRTKAQIEERQPRLAFIKQTVGTLLQVEVSFSKAVNQESSIFQHIVVANFREIAYGIRDAMLLLRSGSLASALALLRPPLEYMLDLVYLGMWPSAAESYEHKALEHNAKLVDGQSIPRDPTSRMRFMNVKTMITKIVKSESCPDIAKVMVDQFNLLSNVVEHTSPEKKNLWLNRPEDWGNVLGQFEITLLCAVYQIYDVEEGLRRVIDQEKELSLEFHRIRDTLNSMMGYDGAS